MWWLCCAAATEIAAELMVRENLRAQEWATRFERERRAQAAALVRHRGAPPPTGDKLPPVTLFDVGMYERAATDGGQG